MDPMQGRHEFTRSELDEITRLVTAKRGASASKQKTIRRQLREMGFYIADFESVARSFGPEDVQRLVTSRRIRVTDEPDATPRLSWWRRLLGVAGIKFS